MAVTHILFVPCSAPVFTFTSLLHVFNLHSFRYSSVPSFPISSSFFPFNGPSSFNYTFSCSFLPPILILFPYLYSFHFSCPLFIHLPLPYEAPLLMHLHSMSPSHLLPLSSVAPLAQGDEGNEADDELFANQQRSSSMSIEPDVESVSEPLKPLNGLTTLGTNVCKNVRTYRCILLSAAV
jgi:hypothetical protein